MTDSAQLGVATALEELRCLVGLGPRFHGTSGNTAAAEFIRGRLESIGLDVEATRVCTPGWDPGSSRRLEVCKPTTRAITCWPMLGSGSSRGTVTARLVPQGPQGLWGDAMVWQRFLAVTDGVVQAYIHARDAGPAAPQPLPAGSDESVAHLAIGQLDGAQLTEWLTNGFEVEVELSADSSSSEPATSENLAVTIDGSDGAADNREVVVCAHYDTFWNTPGAYDNGSGTVALLLLAAEWSQHPPHRTTRIVFFTAEEWHLAGSRSFIESASQSALDSIDFALNIDGLGRGNMLEVFAGPERFEQELTEEIRTFAAHSRDNLRVVSRFPPTMGTDHASFYAAGVPSAHLTFNDLNRLHQPDDLPNDGIAANIAWTVPLVQQLVDVLQRPRRGPISGLI